MNIYKTKQEKLEALMNGQRLTDKEYPDIYTAQLDCNSVFGPFILNPLKDGLIREMDTWWSDEVTLIDYDEWLKEQEEWPRDGDLVYLINDAGNFFSYPHKDCGVHNYRKLQNNIYRTEKTARRARNIDLKIREIAARNPVDWSDKEKIKTRVKYSIEDNILFEDYTGAIYEPGIIYSGLPKGFLEALYEEISEDGLIWYHKLKAGLIKE